MSSTVVKETDFGRSVENGPLAGTPFGQLVRRIMQSRQPGEVRLSDFAFYWPSQNKPAAFMAAPIYKDGVFVGTIVAQISIEAIGALVNDNGKWREHTSSAAISSCAPTSAT